MSDSPASSSRSLAAHSSSDTTSTNPTSDPLTPADEAASNQRTPCEGCDRILNDFENLVSEMMDDNIWTTHQRTGTRPFVAYDSLDPKWAGGYLYRHDLESIFYGLLCLCTRYEGPGELVDVSRRPYKSWFIKDHNHERRSKGDMISDGRINPTVTAFFRSFTPWVTEIYECIHLGHWRRAGAWRFSGFDEITLGGHVTYGEVEAIMSHCEGVPLKTRN
ncbi:hypothetical protein E1B28_012867 [Marasmius oreades]|uniref:Fungal-type protein kinase domain-containing protein n=1 Tax=Marasmius oreades TaxID=181124 RepID=A0A9P7UP60_9AGAR|nr:uncharacterized protein E1B28_012867 [Marasmius oreades]KAG7088923.1 hypothetical protein E1B28_012867 [Marasmius oreades]